jgi:outer membrane receptor for ferrienterochelin and colicins
MLGQQKQVQYRHGQNARKLLVLRGVVKDWDGNPVAQAVVVLPEIGKTVETNNQGRFEFSRIPPGRYHLEVYAPGFVDYSSEPFVLNKDKYGHEVVLMKKLAEEIVVTATRTPKLYAETPTKTEVISSRQIEMKVASNLAEALYQTTGVRVENDCQNCNFTQVRINGMEGKYTQILIDSSPVVSAMTGVYGLEQIPAEMLDRIEIVKGGGSALYGGNAVAGVINVLTKEPQENRTVLKAYQESIAGKPYTDLGFRSSLVSDSLNTKAYLFASYKRREPIDLNDDGFSELGLLSNTSFGLNIYNYFPAVDGKFKLGLFRIFEERRGGNLFDKPPHEADTAEWIKTDQLAFSSEWSHSLSEKLYYNLSFSLVNAKRNTYYGSHHDPHAYGETKNPLFFFNGQCNYQLGSHVLTMGFQMKRDKIHDKAIGYNRVIDQVYYESGLFFQDDFKIGRIFSILTGFRVNRHTALDRLIITPRLSILVNLMKELSFRTSFSTGFRAPQVFDEDLHIEQVGGEGLMIQNSPDLKEERSYSLYSGFDYGRQTGNTLIQFSIEGFYNRLLNTFIFQEVERIERARVLERINGSGSRVYGLSVDFGLAFGPRFSLASGWTFQRSLLDEPEPRFNSREFFRTPKVYGYSSLSWEHPKLFHLDASVEYTGSMKAPHYAGYILEDRLETTSPFWVVNLKFRRQLKLSETDQISIFLGIENLLDSFQKDLDKGVDRDSGYVYGPAKPRTFYLGMEFTF